MSSTATSGRLFDQRDRFFAVGRFRDHVDVARFGQDFADAFAHYGVIIGQDDANGLD